MSLKSEQRDRIKNYMMEKIYWGDDGFISHTSEVFDVSQTTIYKYLSDLISEDKVIKTAAGKYQLKDIVDETYTFKASSGQLSEDVIYDQTLEKYVQFMPEAAVRIWQYAFMEMMNNAIDHSNAENIEVRVVQNSIYTKVEISDDGVGIFKKIADYFEYPKLKDAVLSLFKGKLTTDRANHSGEGIFFSSKAVDHFHIVSDGLIFRQDNTAENVRQAPENFNTKGTTVSMILANNTQRRIKDIFDTYSDIEHGFTTTRIPISFVSDTGYPVSRSQAKRLCFGLDNFEHVILDFDGVSEIGQGFADEVFRVYANNHPMIRLDYENATPDVERIIRHVVIKS